MNKKIVTVFAVLLIAVAGGAFFGGLQFGKSQSSSNMPNFQTGQGNFSRTGIDGMKKAGGVTGGNNMTMGQVISIENDTLTIKLQTGGSKIVLLSDTTKVLKSTDTTKEDLLKDVNVTVTGKTNTDGTVTADTVQIRNDINNIPLNK